MGHSLIWRPLKLLPVRARSEETKIRSLGFTLWLRLLALFASAALIENYRGSDISVSLCDLMDVYVKLCHSFGLPVWIASLLHAAKRLKSDCARRKKVYRLLQRTLDMDFEDLSVLREALFMQLNNPTTFKDKKLFCICHHEMFHRVGVKEGALSQPTFVYPEEVKIMMRSAFPQDICDYPDPCHDQVIYITVEDLHKVRIH